MDLVQAHDEIEIATQGTGFVDISARLGAWLRDACAADGLLTLFIRHTSASLTIQENADPDVQRDLIDALDALAPASRSWRHSTEGSDDMPAHIKSMLTASSLAVPVRRGRLELGTWQAIYLIEHRAAPHRRAVVLHYIGTRES